MDFCQPISSLSRRWGRSSRSWGARRLELATFVYDFSGRSIFPAWLETTINVIQVVVIAIPLYNLFFIPAGIRNRRRVPSCEPRKSFAIIVPAHNEEAVIGPLVENLRHLDYPRDLYDVFVVADNCTDGTARVAREAGAVVLERYNPRARGKGHALEHAFGCLEAGPRRYDAVVVIDADNLVARDFLSAMNARLCQGERVIQGCLDVKNPDDTWISASYAFSYWAANRFWRLGKHNMGFSVSLGGTGMCIDMDLLREIGWSTETLTEDLEFSMKALAHGVKTTWAHEAVVYDEKPLTFAQSFRQRVRWVQGGVQVARRYLGVLIREGLRRRDIAILEGAVVICSYFFLVVGSALGLFFLVADRFYFFEPLIPVAFWWALGGLELGLPLLALLFDRLPVRPYRFLPLFPVFAYSWVLVTWYGMFLSHRYDWSHTRHTRGISYRDLVQQRSAGTGG